MVGVYFPRFRFFHLTDSVSRIERNVDGKVMKLKLRRRVRKGWAQRLKAKAQQSSPKAREKPKPKL